MLKQIFFAASRIVRKPARPPSISCFEAQICILIPAEFAPRPAIDALKVANN